MINRKALVRRHNPVLNNVSFESPLTVGNGEIAFTADITGLQTLYNEYNQTPLCTMSRWGWHTEPTDNGGFFTLDDVEMTCYKSGERKVFYASEEQKGNEEVYNWLRKNPHRLNLAKIALIYENREIKSSDITDIEQVLDLYSGVLRSSFSLHGYKVNVKTICAQNSDLIGFSVDSAAVEKGLLAVSIAFPYGSHKITASDWDSENRHITNIEQDYLLERRLDNDTYNVRINGKVKVDKTGKHEFVISGKPLEFTVGFSSDKNPPVLDFAQALQDSENGWEEFWQNGGAVDFSRSKDKRAAELERRVILSQYLTAVNCSGSQPPQETGLTCNSWYGKFHLEMHILHAGWFPLWGREKLLEKSLGWYESVLDNALKNSARNGYKGARWVKMTGPAGIDSPSFIAVLLIWQQPHIIYMLELIAQNKKGAERLEFMKKYWHLVELTAEFMCDFAQLNSETGKYDLPPPLIPAQEEHKPQDTLNPAFELCYWRFGLKLAISWANELDKDCSEFIKISENLAEIPSVDGLYTAHQNCPDTFEKFNRDHPSMLFGCGFMPCDDIDKQIMSSTCDKVLDCWDFKSMWGWDFALIAMTLTRLGRTDEAIDILLAETDKNSYVASGNNFQRGRTDLPLYLPGNGSLLFALALMLAGYSENKGLIGFPQNGMWEIEVEGINPLPY